MKHVGAWDEGAFGRVIVRVCGVGARCSGEMFFVEVRPPRNEKDTRTRICGL
jgi:hypothetical protein